MKVHNISKKDLIKALKIVNKAYGGNIIFNEEPEPLNKANTAWKVTLKVKDSHKPGAKVSKQYGFNGYRGERHLIHACWHVHGRFIDVVLDLGGWFSPTLINKNPIKTHDDNWQDRIRIPLFGVYESEMCDCDL